MSNRIMKYKKVRRAPADSILLVDHDYSQPSPPSSVEQNKILKNQCIQKYRLPLIVVIFLLLISLIILLAIFIHHNRYRCTSNSSVLTQSATCNDMNGNFNYSDVLSGGCEHFTRVENWDYPHYDMLETVVNEYETCCSMCWHQTSCMAFSYSPTSKACWIKTKLNKDGGYSHSDRISGFLGECTEEERLDNWDYSGNNMFENGMNGSVPASDWQTCCGLCVHQRFCKAYTFSLITHQCWLKTEAGDGSFDSDKISGRRE